MNRPSEHEKKLEDGPVEALPAESEDGGTRAWCTVIGGWLGAFASFGYVSSFGVFEDLYTRSGVSTSSNISWIGSVQLFFLVFMTVPAGALLDKGYFRSVLLAGSLIYVFSIFMLSLAHVDHYYQLFLAQGVGMGIGSGLIYLPSMAVQAQHWKARRSFAMGIVITGSSVGGIIYPIMLNHLFHGSVGFPWGVRSSAFMTLAILALANFLMSPRPTTLQTSVTVKAKPRLRTLLRDDAAYLFSNLSVFIITLGFPFPLFYLQLFTILKGLSPNLAFYTLTILNGASILGRTIPNFLADRFGHINMQLCIYFGTGVTIFGMFGVTNTAGVVVFALFYGFFTGAVFSLFAPVTASFARDPSEVGLRLGIGYAATSLSWLVGPPIYGALVGDSAHWYKAIIFSGVFTLASVPILLVSRHKQAKRKNTPYV